MHSLKKQAALKAVLTREAAQVSKYIHTYISLLYFLMCERYLSTFH